MCPKFEYWDLGNCPFLSLLVTGDISFKIKSGMFVFSKHLVRCGFYALKYAVLNIQGVRVADSFNYLPLVGNVKPVSIAHSSQDNEVTDY